MCAAPHRRFRSTAKATLHRYASFQSGGRWRQRALVGSGRKSVCARRRDSSNCGCWLLSSARRFTVANRFFQCGSIERKIGCEQRRGDKLRVQGCGVGASCSGEQLQGGVWQILGIFGLFYPDGQHCSGSRVGVTEEEDGFKIVAACDALAV